MTTTTRPSTPPAATAPKAYRPSPGKRAQVWLANHFAMISAILVLLYLFLPVAYTFAFSFNDHGKTNIVWQGFTWKHWQDPCRVQGVCESLVTSLEVGVISTVVATVLGTLMALAMVRYRFRGKSGSNVLIFVPMATPEIVMGSSLLALFLNDQNTIQLGFWTIFIAHVMFTISFVVVTVKARLIGFDRHLEEAAMDLGANEWKTFQKVTLPLIAPAMLAAGLLGFALSIDDFVITYLNAGPVQTFPIFVWGIARVAVPPQVNVVASAIFLVAIALGLGNVIWQYRSARRTRSEAAE